MRQARPLSTLAAIVFVLALGAGPAAAQAVWSGSAGLGIAGLYHPWRPDFDVVPFDTLEAGIHLSFRRLYRPGGK